MTSRLIKLAAVVAGSLIAAGAVPAVAAHVSHKHLAARTHVAHRPLLTAVRSRTHTLHTRSLKAKSLAAHHKALKSTHRAVKHLATRTHKAVDKMTAKRSTM